MIESLRLVLQKLPNTRLIIAGEGFFDKYLKTAKYLWSKIIFTGKVEKNDLYNLYETADIGVITSAQEQCSYTAIEMMMHKLPVIVSGAAGLSEMISDGGNGYIAPVLEYDYSVGIYPRHFAAGIVNILTNPDLKRKMSVCSRKRYLKLYTIEHMLNKTIQQYRLLSDSLD